MRSGKWGRVGRKGERDGREVGEKRRRVGKAEKEERGMVSE